ncbi:unnamed protein product [Ceutorhynchus assimilis]|uniref:Uncharacterized protein n=1 Tax=Ceutorhynchus assimilis TaxID=467358 RepID=A0A9N9MF98_9CUCU|nr:unnamed protein product [Ceutorhynchus assimilis]
MSLANVVRASILPPGQWLTHIVKTNMIEGDKIYKTIRNLTPPHDLDLSGFLNVSNFNVIGHDLRMFNRTFSIDYDIDTLLFGNLQDNMNRDNIGLTLHAALTDLFVDHGAGILIADSKAFAVMHYDDKFYFSDLHLCGPKGSKAVRDGKACVIECDSIGELCRICKRTTGSGNRQYTLNYVDVTVINNINSDGPQNEIT